MSDAKQDVELVIIDYHHLIGDHDLRAEIEKAYGTEGLGILGIRNVPDFVEAKHHLLPMAYALAHLPNDYLEENLTDPKSFYNAGWSHGKEKLGDRADTAKGSFYYNPLTDAPGTSQDRQKYPASYPINKWPEESKMPGFREAAKRLGKVLTETAIHVARHVDALAASKLPDYPSNYLYIAMKDTEKAKARLLYYFPTTNPADDSWIGWHNDSGFLTALAGDLYVNHETGAGMSCSPDAAAGLYAITRSQGIIKIDLPADCMAVQIGECTQIITGGAVQATPHCVRGAAANPLVARISLPCFIDTPPDFVLKPASSSINRNDVLTAVSTATHPRVPPLANRWTNSDQTFGTFLQKTFEQYYEWNTKFE